MRWVLAIGVAVVALVVSPSFGAAQVREFTMARPSEGQERAEGAATDLHAQFLFEFQRQAATRPYRWGLDRLRVGARYGRRDEPLDLRLQLELAPRAPALFDLHLTYRVVDALELRVGQQKTPFTRYWRRSVLDLPLANWPALTRYLGGTRQLGLSLARPASLEGIDWAAGIYHGQATNAGRGTDLARAYGENAPNPAGFTGSAELEAPHPELVGRVGSGFALGDTRLYGGGSVSADLQPRPAFDLAGKGALELELRAPRFRASWVGYGGVIRGVRDGTLADGLWGTLFVAEGRVGSVGLATQLAYLATTRHLREDARRWGTVTAQGADGEPAVGDLLSELELTAGVSYEVDGPDLKFVADVSWLRESRDAEREDRFRIRLQLQAGFTDNH